jgi:hypothetical protein
MFNNIGELCPKFKDIPKWGKIYMAFYKQTIQHFYAGQNQRQSNDI